MVLKNYKISVLIRISRISFMVFCLKEMTQIQISTCYKIKSSQIAYGEREMD